MQRQLAESTRQYRTLQRTLEERDLEHSALKRQISADLRQELQVGLQVLRSDLRRTSTELDSERGRLLENRSQRNQMKSDIESRLAEQKRHNAQLLAMLKTPAAAATKSRRKLIEIDENGEVESEQSDVPKAKRQSKPTSKRTQDGDDDEHEAKHDAAGARRKRSAEEPLPDDQRNKKRAKKSPVRERETVTQYRHAFSPAAGLSSSSLGATTAAANRSLSFIARSARKRRADDSPVSEEDFPASRASADMRTRDDDTFTIRSRSTTSTAVLRQFIRSASKSKH